MYGGVILEKQQLCEKSYFLNSKAFSPSPACHHLVKNILKHILYSFFSSQQDQQQLVWNQLSCWFQSKPKYSHSLQWILKTKKSLWGAMITLLTLVFFTSRNYAIQMQDVCSFPNLDTSEQARE